MAMLIDWHSHHTAPELAEAFATIEGQAPRADDHDSPDFSKRLAAMDAAGVALQLVSQGAGLEADRLAPARALEMARRSNDLIAARIEPFRDRLFGVMAISLGNVDESVKEIERMAERGFRAVLLYSRIGRMLDGSDVAEPLFAKISDLNLPIFLHGGGYEPDPSLERLEDRGAGVAASAIADGKVSECAVRMIASGLFDRYPNLQVVIRSGGGTVALLLHKLFWKHKGPRGEQRYAEILLNHFLVDTASVNARTLEFLIDTMGEERVVFGSDYCGGLGPLPKALAAIEQHPQPRRVREITERNSRRLLGL